MNTKELGGRWDAVGMNPDHAVLQVGQYWVSIFISDPLWMLSFMISTVSSPHTASAEVVLGINPGMLSNRSPPARVDSLDRTVQVLGSEIWS